MRRREFFGILGGAVAWPMPILAQQAKPVIGFLSSRSAEESASAVAAFATGLSEAGYIEGRNLSVEYRWAAGHYDQLSTLAAELVNLRVAAIFAPGGTDPAVAAKALTDKIPIVFISAADPVQHGLVASLNRPGGNVTGVSLIGSTLEAKRLEMLHRLLPSATSIGALVNPNYPDAQFELSELQKGAEAIGLKIHVANASREEELSKAIASLSDAHVGALLVATDVFLLSQREQIVTLAARNRLPAMYGFREIAKSGGLMSYGPNLPDAYHTAGLYVARILKGEKPADLPVVQPTTFEFVINLKVAKALGLEIPANVLALADEVIE
jgi:putative tryptophan/tyrosine transport system substrate-binding protein